MAYVKIKFEPLLWVVKADTRGMYSIGYCLTDDISYGRGHKRISWILDDRYDTTCSNRTFMEKDNDKVITGDLLTENYSEAAISVPTSAMIDLLQQWDEVCKTNPEEVTIYYENEKFRIEAKPRVQDKNE